MNVLNIFGWPFLVGFGIGLVLLCLFNYMKSKFTYQPLPLENYYDPKPSSTRLSKKEFDKKAKQVSDHFQKHAKKKAPKKKSYSDFGYSPASNTYNADLTYVDTVSYSDHHTTTCHTDTGSHSHCDSGGDFSGGGGECGGGGSTGGFD